MTSSSPKVLSHGAISAAIWGAIFSATSRLRKSRGVNAGDLTAISPAMDCDVLRFFGRFLK